MAALQKKKLTEVIQRQGDDLKQLRRLLLQLTPKDEDVPVSADVPELGSMAIPLLERTSLGSDADFELLHL